MYWIRFTIEECVLCGAHHEYRERVYDAPKPEDASARYVFTQFACGHHFC
jgi:hypothetical protein